MKKLLMLFIFCFTCSSYSADNAESLFKELAPSLFQIKLIDIASGEKSSIGSAFQINENGLIATNYHVISGYARHPDKFRMEYLDHLGNTGLLSLESVDIVNDLALVKRDLPTKSPFFLFTESTPKKGEELYSLGNPHDLGMIVVPGTYNGLNADSFNDRIHFTGSVNSGMSGGPVVNSNAEVIGINVATSGNQIGFLVPYQKLLQLIADYQQHTDIVIKEQMRTQLIQNQNNLINEILSANWMLRHLGQKQALIPTIDLSYIRCWGNSNTEKKEELYFLAFANCVLDEDIYIEKEFFTGSIEIQYNYLEAKELNEMKFYNLFQNLIGSTSPHNKAGKNHVGEFSCNHDIIEASNKLITNKAIFCSRAYQDFPELFDVVYIAASVDKNDKALISHFTLAGVEQKNALLFTEKFIESVSWEQ